MLTVRGLRRMFGSAGRAGTVALDDVDLVVPTGAFASVLGPSGSGKTTLLRCIAGFERPDAGTITLGDRDLFTPTVNLPPYARAVGIVPQEGALFPHLSVADNIGFGLPRRTRRPRVEELLELVGLVGLGRRRPDQLSGGQQQRVALARALAPEPQLVLLDEPFSALDAQLRVELREEVRDLLQATGSTALLVTHDQAEAMSLANQLIVMREGRVIAAGDADTIYDHPVDADLGRFLGAALVIPGRISRGADGEHVMCALGRLKVAGWDGADGPCDVLVRPEHIRLDTVSGQSPTALTGTVCSRLYFGHDALIRVAVPGVEQPVPVRIPGPQRTHQVGDRVELRVTDPVSVYPPTDSLT